MVAIQRRDNSMWAIPGGMVDANEKFTTTLKREFMEEALNSREGILFACNFRTIFGCNI